jgi:glycosyltransferase involved in cell wall biosynthesis
LISDPLISIIIPVLNGQVFLDRCFSSLEKQTYPSLEVIFVDNGSIDGSRERIDKYCTEHENYYLIDCYELGPGRARNSGINFASGEYISFLDVDDELEPEKHRILLEGLQYYPQAAIAIGQTKIKYSYGKELMAHLGSLSIGLNVCPSPGLLWLKQFQHNPSSCSYLIKKTIIDNHKYAFSDFQFGEDIAFNVLIGLQNDVVIIDKLVSTYHRHSDSAVTKASQQISNLERYFQFYEKFALPLFYKKRGEEPFNQAFNVSEQIAFRMLMKLIHVEKKKNYKNVYKRLVKLSYLQNRSFFYIFFHFCSFRISNYIFEKCSFR